MRRILIPLRASDAAFVRQDKMESLEDDSGYLPFAPDLAVEVVSPSDQFADVERRAFSWLDAGTQLVLIVDPETEMGACVSVTLEESAF